MKRYLIFAGTTEGRLLSEAFVAGGIPHCLSVATDYGELMIKPSPLVELHKGRLGQEEMADFVGMKGDVVFDATHPFATIVTENIRAACRQTGASYIRIVRRGDALVKETDGISYYESSEKCAEALKETEGNVLLTTGSKDLEIFSENEKLRERIYARVLPSEESIGLCASLGISGKQVIAMQGPFDVDMNKALISQFKIAHLVTKESGAAGGFTEKLRAAQEASARLHVIGRKAAEEGMTVGEAARKFGGKVSVDISLVGIGPGKKDCITEEVRQAISRGEILFGAERMIRNYRGSHRCYPYYLARDVVPLIKDELPARVAILFSGDSGFYSGAEKMKRDLTVLLDEAGIDGNISILPGISSLSYFAAKIGVSYSDSLITSLHGKSADQSRIKDLLKEIKKRPKVFTLLSGKSDISLLAERLTASGLGDAKLTIGYNLSYEDECVLSVNAAAASELARLEEGLYVMLIENPLCEKQRLIPTIPDEEFIRERVPMTKAAVRHLSVMRLDLREGDVLYDVGAGTGSIGIEAALLDETLTVYAIEKKEEAINLIHKNKEKFRAHNLIPIRGDAPAAFENLEPPTHAFIGGSSGNMASILETLKKMNPRTRIVINAVSLETISEVTDYIKKEKVSNLLMEQVAVSNIREMGSYHLMNAENPILIVSFDFTGATASEGPCGEAASNGPCGKAGPADYPEGGAREKA